MACTWPHPLCAAAHSEHALQIVNCLQTFSYRVVDFQTYLNPNTYAKSSCNPKPNPTLTLNLHM